MRRMLILARSFSFLIFTLHISITEVLPSFATALRRVIGCTVVTVQCRFFFFSHSEECNMNLKSMSNSINVASRKSHFKRLLSFFHEQLQWDLSRKLFIRIGIINVTIERLLPFTNCLNVSVDDIKNKSRNWNISYIHKLLWCVLLKIIYSFAFKSLWETSTCTCLFTLALCKVETFSHFLQLRFSFSYF